MPKKIVFVTVGTSALEKNFSIRDHNRNVEWGGDKGLDELILLLNTQDESQQSEAQQEFEHQKNYVVSELKNKRQQFLEKVEEQNREKYALLSSELASLIAMEKAKETDEVKVPGLFSENDVIYLLHSDTAEGRLCAEVIEATLPDYIKLPPNIEIVTITGLQMNNPYNFLTVGIPNLMQAVEDRVKEFTVDYYLNITGGYKGSIPFLTVLAAELRESYEVYLVYLFEKAPEVLIRPAHNLKTPIPPVE